MDAVQRAFGVQAYRSILYGGGSGSGESLQLVREDQRRLDEVKPYNEVARGDEGVSFLERQGVDRAVCQV